ncbi:putative PEP-binding protein [Acidiphilium sp.]
MPLSFCGEAAGDPGIAQDLVRAGLRRLSMAPASFGPVRHALEHQVR